MTQQTSRSRRFNPTRLVWILPVLAILFVAAILFVGGLLVYGQFVTNRLVQAEDTPVMVEIDTQAEAQAEVPESADQEEVEQSTDSAPEAGEMSFGAHAPDVVDTATGEIIQCTGIVLGQLPDGYLSMEPASRTRAASCATGLLLERIGTEADGYTWRGKPMSSVAFCPIGHNVVCTWDVVDDITVIHEGIGQASLIYAGTFRVMDLYEGESLCEVVTGELAFAAQEAYEARFQPVTEEMGGSGRMCGNPAPVNAVPSADTAPATQPTAVPPQGGAATVLTCPVFGGVQTNLGNDGSDFCKLDTTTPVTDVVPTGMTIEYWDGEAVQNAPAGAQVTTATATFRPVGN